MNDNFPSAKLQIDSIKGSLLIDWDKCFYTSIEDGSGLYMAIRWIESNIKQIKRPLNSLEKEKWEKLLNHAVKLLVNQDKIIEFEPTGSYCVFGRKAK